MRSCHCTSGREMAAGASEAAGVGAVVLLDAAARHRQFDIAISPRWDVDENLATMLCVLTNAGTRVGHSERASSAKRRINRGFDGAFDVVVPSRWRAA